MLEISTFLARADDSLKAPWLDRLSSLGMDCEFHPDFSFNDQTGFLPIRVQLRKPTRQFATYADFLTGFEFYSEDFDLDSQFPKVGVGLARFFRGIVRVSKSVDPVLKICRKQLIFRWSSAEMFELRMATMSSLVLAELAGGISYYPADGTWYEGHSAISETLHEIEAYERGLREEDAKLYPFDGWF